MDKKSKFYIDAIKDKNISFLKELDDILTKKGKRLKTSDANFAEHHIKLGELRAVIKALEEL